MNFLRLSTRMATATALIILTMSGEAGAQTASGQASKTPAELARAIAATISANMLRTPGAAISFESATSRDNVVEMRYSVRDAAALARIRSNASEVRAAKASYYCNESRLTYLRQGVVMREVIAVPGSSDQVDFTFDKSSCDKLPEVKLADSATLARMAQSIAKTESEALGKPSDSPFQLSEVTAKQGTVEERFVIRDASTFANTPANRDRIRGVLSGYFCAKYRDSILQGLIFHHFFVLADGSPVIDYTIGKPSCT